MRCAFNEEDELSDVDEIDEFDTDEFARFGRPLSGFAARFAGGASEPDAGDARSDGGLLK